MDLVKLKPLDVWKSAAGLCLICGMPLGLEAEGKNMKEALTDEADEEDHDEEEMDSAAQDKVRENFVRVALFQHNLLGSVEKCHIIDRYTFLKGYEPFKKALKENSAVVEALGGDLSRSSAVEVAVACLWKWLRKWL